MATIQEIAQKCGISVSTVSKALNGYSDISDKTKEMVIKTAQELGYSNVSNSKTMKIKKSYNIGVLFTTSVGLGFRNSYFTEILTEFKSETAKRGYNLTLIERQIGSRKMSYLEHCQYRNFDGILLLNEDCENKEVIELVESDLPVVTIDYSFQNAYSIISDNYNGIKQLVNYIIYQGHTNIAMIHGSDSLVTSNRINGFLDGLQEKGIKVPNEYIVPSEYKNIEKAQEAALRLLQLSNRPSCILAPDDYSTIGVINAIRKSGLKLAKDVSVAGYDGIDSSQIIGIKMTTMKQDTKMMGGEAANKLIQMIEKPNKSMQETLFIKQALIKGNSVGKIS